MSAPSMQTQQSFNPYTNAPQQQYNPFSYYDQPYQQSRAQPMSVEYPYQQQQPQYSPFSYQQPSYQQQSYQPSYQPQYNPYQMQSPFSYQQPAPMPQRTSSGPSQAIVGRSSQMRGTPNVMRRAEGGIASLMDDVE